MSFVAIAKNASPTLPTHWSTVPFRDAKETTFSPG
jgi:hypothetical protein